MHCVEQAALGAEPPHAPAAQACDAPHCPPALHTWIQVVGSPATEPGGTTHCRAPGAHAMPQIADRDGVVPVLVHVCKPPSADAEQGVYVALHWPLSQARTALPPTQIDSPG